MRSTTLTVWWMSWLSCAGAAACASDGAGDKGAELGAPSDGKADGFDSVATPHGYLQFGGESSARIESGARVHTWQLALGADAEVTLETKLAHAPNDEEIDTVLYLYAASGGRYLAKNDDISSSNTFSRIRTHLPAGEYRLVLKGYSALDTGQVRIGADCSGEGCGGNPSDALCLFGPTLYDLTHSPNLETVAERQIRSARDIQGTLVDQIIALPRIEGRTATNLDAAISALKASNDRGRLDLHLTELRDPVTQATYVELDYQLGEITVGYFFPADSARPVASMSDGEIGECAVFEAPDRWNGLTVTQAELPRAISGLSEYMVALRIEGLPAGDQLSVSGGPKVLERARQVLGTDCNEGGIAADVSDVTRRDLGGVFYLLEHQIDGFASAPNAAQVGQLVDYLVAQAHGVPGDQADQIDDLFIVDEAPISNGDCRGTTSGTVLMITNRISHEALVLTLIEEAE